MTTPFRAIGCCIDHSPAGRAVVAEGVRLRETLGGERLHLVHVLEPPAPLHAGPYTYLEPREVVRSDEGHWLDERVAAVPGSTGVLLEGEPSEAICRWADGAGIDLLIVAPHRGAIGRALHGSFARRLAHDAPCPVLVLRRPG